MGGWFSENLAPDPRNPVPPPISSKNFIFFVLKPWTARMLVKKLHFFRKKTLYRSSRASKNFVYAAQNPSFLTPASLRRPPFLSKNSIFLVLKPCTALYVYQRTSFFSRKNLIPPSTCIEKLGFCLTNPFKPCAGLSIFAKKFDFSRAKIVKCKNLVFLQFWPPKWVPGRPGPKIVISVLAG